MSKETKIHLKKKNNSNMLNINSDDRKLLGHTNNKVNNNLSQTAATLPGLCVVCWDTAIYFCPDCKLIGFCCLSHMAKYWQIHDELCTVIQRILPKYKGSLFGTQIMDDDQWRKERINIIVKVTRLLKRNLLPYERDLLLFPKHCSCYETDLNKITDCKKCHQVWYCKDNKTHLKKSHNEWCPKLILFSTLTRRQAAGKSFIFDMNSNLFESKPLQLGPKDNIKIAIENVLQINDTDGCKSAIISQIASGPLTILHAMHMTNFKTKKSLTIHLIGAEMHYEGSSLQSWEYFFLHFLPQIFNLKIIMIGPELNLSNIKSEKVRLCEECQVKKRNIVLQYQDGLLYHEYVQGGRYTKPDLVCAFNPGLHRYTGYDQRDTWPLTIKKAVSSKYPFIFTAYTSYEAPLDLNRVQECAAVNVILPPSRNPFASLKPDRNFISDHEVPLIFKNYYMTIVSGVV